MRHLRYSIEDTEPDADQAAANRQTASLAGLAVALFIVVAGLFLFRHLHATTFIEDCLLAGHTDCDTILVATP
jgi:hypothetical protein